MNYQNKNIPTGWAEFELGKVLKYEQPFNYIVKNEEYKSTGIPV
ncbi:MAG: restriction endonuclease subunit S, partial [Calditrichaeota bacterium]